MNTSLYKITKIAAMLIGGAMLGSGIAPAQVNGVNAGAEVLTRGPVHEAFAGTVMFNPEAGIIVDLAPPALIEEVPPEQRLAGDNVAWIPGYWAWDEDQNDFIWISGIWRHLPPGREWIPGYWAEVDGRYQWTSGYWEDAQAAEVIYLPKPPRSVESGPNIDADSIDQTWIPGNWVYRDARYAWRAGYWVDARESWSWTPAYYRWTQRGYVYVDGYWDYPVIRRGVVFAPVRFDRAYVSRPGFFYSPLTAIALSVFTDHLFLRPSYGHYYFGDYYEPSYRDRGFYASYSYNSGYRGYDPIYAHNRWENRNDRNWSRQRQDYYEYRRDHADARPPRTWAALSARSQQDRDRRDFGVADRFDRVVGARSEGGPRFQKVDAKERERFVSQREEVRKFGKERAKLETKGERVKDGANDKANVLREKVGRSPVVARESGRSNKDGGPPQRLQPRMSDKDQGDVPTGKSGKDGKSDRQNEPGAKGKSDEETRTKPGQKREAKPSADRKDEPGNKGKAKSIQETRPKPGQKREDNPDKERKATPEPKREANPTPERKPKPEPERKPKANPSEEPRKSTNDSTGKSKEKAAVPAEQPQRKKQPQAEPQSSRKSSKPATPATETRKKGKAAAKTDETKDEEGDSRRKR